MAEAPVQLRSSTRPAAAARVLASVNESRSTAAVPADAATPAALLLPPPRWPAMRQRRTVRVRRTALPASRPWLESQRCPELLSAQHMLAAEHHHGQRQDTRVAVASPALHCGTSAAAGRGGHVPGPTAAVAQAPRPCCGDDSASETVIRVLAAESAAGCEAAAGLLRESEPLAAVSASCAPPLQLRTTLPWDSLSPAPLCSEQPAALMVSALSAALQQPGHRFDADLVQPDEQPWTDVHRTQLQGRPCPAPLTQNAVAHSEGARLDSKDTQHDSAEQLTPAGASEWAAGADAACATTRSASRWPEPAALTSIAAVPDLYRPLQFAHDSAQGSCIVESSMPAPAQPRLSGASTAQTVACVAALQPPPTAPPGWTSADPVVADQRGEKQQLPAAGPPTAAAPLLPAGCTREELPASSAAAMSGAQSGSSAQTAVISKGDAGMPTLDPTASPALRLELPRKVCCPPCMPLGLICGARPLRLFTVALARQWPSRLIVSVPSVHRVPSQVRQHQADALAEQPDVLADAELAAALGAASDAGSEQSPERRQTRQSRRPPRCLETTHTSSRILPSALLRFLCTSHCTAHITACRCCALRASFAAPEGAVWLCRRLAAAAVDAAVQVMPGENRNAGGEAACASAPVDGSDDSDFEPDARRRRTAAAMGRGSRASRAGGGTTAGKGAGGGGGGKRRRTAAVKKPALGRVKRCSNKQVSGL